MKKLAAIALALLFVTPLLAQVEMGKTKQTIMGKGKLLGVKQQEMILDNFGINIILYNFAEDQGGNAAKGNMAQVGVRANLVEVDEAMAQEIVNEAYSYFVEQWKSRGVTVVSPTKEELEATKKFSKAKVKAKKQISYLEEPGTTRAKSITTCGHGQREPILQLQEVVRLLQMETSPILC